MSLCGMESIQMPRMTRQPTSRRIQFGGHPHAVGELQSLQHAYLLQLPSHETNYRANHICTAPTDVDNLCLLVLTAQPHTTCPLIDLKHPPSRSDISGRPTPQRMRYARLKSTALSRLSLRHSTLSIVNDADPTVRYKPTNSESPPSNA